MSQWIEIAPLIRGLTGTRFGLHVSSFDAGHAESAGDRRSAERAPSSAATGALRLPPFRTGADYHLEVVEAFSSALTAMGGDPPSQIVVGSHGVFGLGRDIDEAASNARLPDSTANRSVAPTPVESNDTGEPHAISSRSVVRGAVSVVTGGAQGFGAEIVRHLAGAGSTVFVVDRNEVGTGTLAEELNDATGRTVAVPIGADVSSEASVISMVDQIRRRAGGIDIFVSNAGVLRAGSVKELDLDAFELVTSINYTGYFLGVKHVAPIMALQHIGDPSYFSDIIQINSKSGLEGSNKNGAYAGGKFGGIGLTQSFALELIADGIKVNSICPGNFFEGPLWSDPESGLFVQYLKAGKVPGAKSVDDVRAFYESKVPMKRGCTGADVMKAIYYVVEQTYETGQAVPVTGGQVMLN